MKKSAKKNEKKNVKLNNALDGLFVKAELHDDELLLIIDIAQQKLAKRKAAGPHIPPAMRRKIDAAFSDIEVGYYQQDRGIGKEVDIAVAAANDAKQFILKLISKLLAKNKKNKKKKRKVIHKDPQD